MTGNVVMVTLSGFTGYTVHNSVADMQKNKLEPNVVSWVQTKIQIAQKFNHTGHWGTDKDCCEHACT